MKRYLKIIIISALVLLICTLFIRFFDSRIIHGWVSFEANFNKMMLTLSLSVFFTGLMFLIDIRVYRKIWRYLLVFALLGWVGIYSLEMFNFRIESEYFWYLWDILMFLTYSIVGPGLILYTIHYIEKNSEKFANAEFLGKYHIHEGFVGIIFIIIACILFPLRSFMVGEAIFHNELIFLLGTTQLFIFAFMFFGNFLIIRDLRDVIRLKWIEKKNQDKSITKSNQDISVFSSISKEDLQFFKFSKILLYPMGIILTCISINAIVFGSTFLPSEIFYLNYPSVVLLGFFFGFISGGLVGHDWLRLFKRFCPRLYGELKRAIDNLNDNK